MNCITELMLKWNVIKYNIKSIIKVVKIKNNNENNNIIKFKMSYYNFSFSNKIKNNFLRKNLI